MNYRIDITNNPSRPTTIRYVSATYTDELEAVRAAIRLCESWAVFGRNEPDLHPWYHLTRDGQPVLQGPVTSTDKLQSWLYSAVEEALEVV